jgi:hypothetical protein
MIRTTSQSTKPLLPGHGSSPSSSTIDTADRQDQYPVDDLLPEPSDMKPLCDEQQFAAFLDSMVADEAPRLFAVVQEYGQRADGWIAAWGMAFENHAEVIGVDRGLRMTLQTPENALRVFAWSTHISTRLVWVQPGRPVEDDEAA